jgi:hypothetical protein
MKDVLKQMQMKFPYQKQQSMSETFEDELDIILQFLCSFEAK